VRLKKKSIANDVLYLFLQAVDHANRYIAQKTNNTKIYDFGVIFGPLPWIFLAMPLPLALALDKLQGENSSFWGM
jgi:hypothetical protein